MNLICVARLALSLHAKAKVRPFWVMKSLSILNQLSYQKLIKFFFFIRNFIEDLDQFLSIFTLEKPFYSIHC